jgi:hypothetical protein
MAGFNRHIILLAVAVTFLIFSGCADRVGEPDLNGQLKIFKLKDGTSVVDNIQFGRKFESETGELIGENDKFIIMDEGWVQAIVSLSENVLEKDNLSMFHFDWISPSGYTTYLKREDHTLNDTLDYLKSAISLSPDVRSPGIYKLRIYYFREMIAEKSFELLPEFDLSLYDLEALAENLVVCKDTDRKTGEPSGINTEFIQSNDGSIWAIFKLENEIHFNQEELLFRFDWYKNGESSPFYSKDVDVLTMANVEFISSSLSTSPEKRYPGNYTVVLNVFGKPILQKDFALLPPLDFSSIQVDIILYKKKSTKNGKLIGKGTQFEIGKKNKVRALVNISGLDEYVGKELEFKLRWVGPDGKSFFTKDYQITPDKSSTSIESAISIPSGKRAPGEYNLEIYLEEALIGEKNFELQ